MSTTPSSFLMLRVPLIASGIIYFALAWFVPSLGLFEETPGVATQFQALGFFLGTAAITLGCVCHIRKPLMFWTLFVTTVMYVPSLFFFLGIPMLMFLLRTEVQDYYGVCLTKPKSP